MRALAWRLFAFALCAACKQVPTDQALPEGCSLAGIEPPKSEHPTENSSMQLCSSDPSAPDFGQGTPCACENYQEFPPGTYNQYLSASLSPVSCKDADSSIEITVPSNAFVRPSCAIGAEASGAVVGARSVFRKGGDDDVTFNMCPDVGSMRIFPLQYQPVELRGYKAFQIPDPSDGDLGQNIVGRIHVEVQGCRFYDGVYAAVVPSDVTGGHPELVAFQTRPGPGDLVSVAGDWVDDSGHDYWTELHEARAIAAVHSISDDQHPLSGQIALAFVSAFFADESFQRDSIALDILIPRPIDPRLATLTCVIDTSAAIGPAHCPTYQTIPAEVVPDSTRGTCHLTLLRPRWVQPLPYSCDGACGRWVPSFKLSPEEQAAYCLGAGPTATCFAHFDFADLAESDQCANVQYAGVVRAHWQE